jgi:hypothetical protein
LRIRNTFFLLFLFFFFFIYREKQITQECLKFILDRPVGPKTNYKTLPKLGECGKSDSSNRIIGGRETDIAEFPWMALIQYENGEHETKTIEFSRKLISHKKNVVVRF